MDLKTYVEPRGAQTRLAEQIAAQPQLVGQWSSGVRPVPFDRCPDIERASEGAVTCEEMRADLRWERKADKAWPWHPKGRPLLDVAAEAA